jgi:hypothetical protein
MVGGVQSVHRVICRRHRKGGMTRAAASTAPKCRALSWCAWWAARAMAWVRGASPRLAAAASDFLG